MFGLFKQQNTEKAITSMTSSPRVVTSISDFISNFIASNRATAPVLTLESSLETQAVLAAVKCIVSSVSSTPLRLMEEYEENGLEYNRVAKKHPLYKLLDSRKGRPNMWQTPQQFVESMLVNAILGKGGLAMKTIVRGKVTELIPVPAGAWTAFPQPDTSVLYRVILADGREVTLKQDEVVFIRGISLDGYSGVSFIEKARKAVGMSHYLEDQQLQLAASGGNPSGVLTFVDTLAADRKAAIRESWQSAYGPGGKGGVAILDAGAKFEGVSMSMADAQFIENRKFQIDEIARAFNIQPLFLGQNGGINPDGVDAAMRFHVKNCLMPWFKGIEACLNRDLLSQEDNFYFDFDERELLRGDLKELMETYMLGMGQGGSAGIFSPNEVRKEFGENPINEPWAMKPTKGGYELSAKPQQNEDVKE